MEWCSSKALASIALCAIAVSCRGDRDEGGLQIPAPHLLLSALSIVSDLGARAQLVPNGGMPGSPIVLSRGADGISFSGFVAASAGDYTIEIAFDGVAAGSRVFLGRWASDVFTVAAGDVASAVFSKPLDTIGRPEDHGDDDQDRLGVLDELLWGTNLALADTDGDGVLDGSDCDPNDRMKTFTIVDAGTIEDCDGDGLLRSDLTYRTPGLDCDDHNAMVRECIADDTRGPDITLLDPVDGATLGCHRKIKARISDPGGVSESSVDRFEAGSPALVERLRLFATSGDELETRELNIATSIWMEDGPELFVIRARDNRGNTSTSSLTVNFDLDVPAATMTPAVVGSRDMPFTITVSATAPAGIASIRLMATRLTGGTSADRAGEIELDSAIESPVVRFTVDPSQLAAGDYAIYPIVVDTIGNRLDPDDSFSLDSLPSGEFVTDPYYICVFDPGPQKVPVRLLTVGGSAIPPAKMRDHFAEAMALAQARDPGAVLIEIRGWGLENDGTIQLGQVAGGDGKWWRYEFFNFTEDRHIEITWYAAAEGIPNPEVMVTENSPFGGNYRAVANPNALVDSDVAVQAYRAASGGRCPALTGLEADVIRYESDQPFTAADVIRIEVGDNTWKATATDPVTEIWACP